MLDLTPPLSVSIAPLTEASGGDVKHAVTRAAAAGMRAVQLSAAQPGMRPRELGHTARRDVLSMLGRSGLMLSGVDLMIPHRDWADASKLDRAATAALAAIELAADLGRVPVSLTLPVESMPADVMRELLIAADGRGVALGIHAEHDLEALKKFLTAHETPLLGAALDPAALLAEGLEPEAVVGRFADRLKVARLDDFARTSVATTGGRCAVGEGELDVDAYRATLSLARGLRAVVIELRDVRDPLAALAAAREAWGE
jgi:sugar phosphate isomerase/epimerase